MMILTHLFLSTTTILARKCLEVNSTFFAVCVQSVPTTLSTVSVYTKMGYGAARTKIARGSANSDITALRLAGPWRPRVKSNKNKN